ncbi:6-phosphogluconolactonase [Mactra antiquata]
MALRYMLLVMLLLCMFDGVTMIHTYIVIIGGTGDLARKYLWGSALQLFVQHYNENCTFSFYAGARVTQDTGHKALGHILENVQCGARDQKCEKLRPTFIENTKYVMLKTDEHYKELCDQYGSGTKTDENIQQIFYLSVPSSAYQSVSKNIHTNCRRDFISTTRVVLEKPFGHDKHSAEVQAAVIGQYFNDNEVRRVDHYLAKSVSKQILSFRSVNRDNVESLLSNEFVDRVEIVMKEQIGVKGRIDFYDQTGVIRDVMQNHLTELLALVAMELPMNMSAENIEQYKLRLLSQVTPVNKDAILTGQYMEYIKEAREEVKNTSQSMLTPTFSAVLLNINSARWRRVPFILTSGKHMDERSSHIRILFREREFCVSGCVDGNSTFTKYPRQLVFQIGHGHVPSAGILVSRSLFKPKWPPGMNELPMTSKDSRIHGQSPGDFYYAVPTNDIPAYTTVVSDLYNDVRETFVSANRMLALWDIRDNVLQDTQSGAPRLYKKYEAENLHFVAEGMKLKYLSEDLISHFVQQEESRSQHVIIPHTFRNRTLVCKSTQKLLSDLALYIYACALTAVNNRGDFHLALSGGRTPVVLFKEIVSNYPMFPSEQTHIWQVDERCASHDSEHSNFLSILSNLVNFVHIPYFNIHPMPVDFAGKICDPENRGDNLYEKLINQNVPLGIFDLILLGLGTDGHTASLFPGVKQIEDSIKFVSLISKKDNSNIDRMTLLPPLINKAREVTVLVTGVEKFDILHKISSINSVTTEFPITLISPVSGNLSWFIDLEAWTGYS